MSTRPPRRLPTASNNRNQIGIDVAVEALRDFSRKYRGETTDLAGYVRIYRVTRVTQPYLDAIA